MSLTEPLHYWAYLALPWHGVLLWSTDFSPLLVGFKYINHSKSKNSNNNNTNAGSNAKSDCSDSQPTTTSMNISFTEAVSRGGVRNDLATCTKMGPLYEEAINIIIKRWETGAPTSNKVETKSSMLTTNKRVKRKWANGGGEGWSLST